MIQPARHVRNRGARIADVAPLHGDYYILRESYRRRKMYCGHARLCVFVSVCLSAAVRSHYCTNPM